METIKDKMILIAGASGGIGAETARLLHSSGGKVYLLGRNLEKLNALASELQLDESHMLQADISNEEDVTNAFSKLMTSTEGKLDILVNAAGVGIVKPVEQLTSQDFLRSLNWNLYGAFLLAKNALVPMKEAKKGLIINIPGVLGKTPMAGAAAYSASKYGLVGMTQSLREEVKRTEIRFTNLFLGGTDTPFWDEIDLRVQRDKFVTSKEAARTIWFLCQQPSSAVVSEMVVQPFNHQAI